MTAALRARRAAAAQALAPLPRRAQLGWDDLAAWPAWAALDDEALQKLAWRCGAWLHAGAWQRCIAGPLLQKLRAELGPAAFERLLQTPGDGELPAADGVLTADGLEALFASVPSPLLRVVLRERFAPATLPPLPALDAARARQAVSAALESAR
jgi:hypothetical protein